MFQDEGIELLAAILQAVMELERLPSHPALLTGTSYAVEKGRCRQKKVTRCPEEESLARDKPPSLA